MRAERPSLRDVARLAGVSVATASGALRAVGRVAEVTQQRVRAAALHLGYVQDLQLSALARRRFRDATADNRSKVVLLWPHPGQHSLMEPERAAWVAEAERMGLRMTQYLVEPEADVGRLWQDLAQRGTQAVAVALAERPPCWPLPAEWEAKAVVDGPAPVGWRCSTVEIDCQATLARVEHECLLRGLGGDIGLALLQQPRPTPTDSQWQWAARALLAGAPAGRYTEPLLELSRDDPARLLAWYRRCRPAVIIISDAALLQPLFSEVGRSLCRFVALELPPSQAKGTELPTMAGFLTTRPQRWHRLCAELQQICQRPSPLPPVRHLVAPDWQEGESLPKRMA